MARSPEPSRFAGGAGRDAVAAYLTDQAGVVGQLKFTIVDVRAQGETVVLRVELTLHGPGKRD